MKLGAKTNTFKWSDREIGKLVDIENITVTITGVSYYMATNPDTGAQERKVTFILDGDDVHFFYFPNHIAKNIDIETIDAINKGDYANVKFYKTTNDKNGRTYWNLEDVE